MPHIGQWGIGSLCRGWQVQETYAPHHHSSRSSTDRYGPRPGSGRLPCGSCVTSSPQLQGGSACRPATAVVARVGSRRPWGSGAGGPAAAGAERAAGRYVALASPYASMTHSSLEAIQLPLMLASMTPASRARASRSEEHTSELQSHSDLVCRLLLE